MTITGAAQIAGEEIQAEKRFTVVDPSTEVMRDGEFSETDVASVNRACTLAAQAAHAYGATDCDTRAVFLERIAEEIDAIGDDLIVNAMGESGLPRARLEGERTRTMNQLCMFADHLRKGEWQDIVIDQALPDRKPPRGDLRRLNLPIGPVAIFGASNFPLAFSVAGGDTASALAAGCPVVVKGHPAHPSTGELVARAICAAMKACELPAGVFAYLPGSAHELGQQIVEHPAITAVGFTGSRSGGLALQRIAAARSAPIPVYAEMSSINPVLLMEGALVEKAEALGEAFANSLTMGAGQFCTNPGLVLALDTPQLDKFIGAAHAALELTPPQVMLTDNIHAAYVDGVALLEAHDSVETILFAPRSDEPNRCSPALFQTSGAAFLKHAELGDEVFGAASLVVRCADMAEMEAVLGAMEGQLTATIHCTSQDEVAAARLIPLLAAKAGRVLANGWPTGVEVTAAMVHGGPYPATTDGRTTSVGTLAIQRFLRPVCFQDLPEALLPKALRT